MKTEADVDILEAGRPQWGELFTLQRAAFVDEAILYATPSVPALLETFAVFSKRHAESTTLVAVCEHRIVGAVSARQADPHPEIERLMVAPDRRGEGIASRLMFAIEQRLAEDGHAEARLVVGGIAVENLNLYERLGYAAVERSVILTNVDAIVMQKPLSAAKY